MKEISVNVRSISYKVKGQGVDSAFKDHVAMLKKSKKLRVFVNEKRLCDVLHIHTIDLGSYRLMKWYKRKGKRVVVSVHVVPESIEGSLKLPKIAKQIFFKYMINFYRSADCCVVVNSHFKKELEKLGLTNVVFIPNVASEDLFYPVENKREIREQLGLPVDTFIVIGAGQIQKRKGIDDFIKTAQMVKNAVFVWLGGFSFGRLMDGYERYKEVVENPPENVIFTGIVERRQVSYYLNAADLFFLPSYQELFPMAVLEASNCGLPLLLRDLDLYKEILFDKYVAGRNAKEFAEMVERFMNDQDFRKSYTRKALELSKIYSTKNVLKRWEELYKELTSNLND